MLAIALYIDRYTKDLTDATRANIESKWLGRWKDKLGQPARTPHQVMKTYCENFNISTNHLDQAMDWDCWPLTDPEPDELDMDEWLGYGLTQCVGFGHTHDNTSNDLPATNDLPTNPQTTAKAFHTHARPNKAHTDTAFVDRLPAEPPLSIALPGVPYLLDQTLDPPVGSIIDHITRHTSTSPTKDDCTHPTNLLHTNIQGTVESLPTPTRPSLIHIQSQPRIFGLRPDDTRQPVPPPCLMDGGANICVTGNLNNLIDVRDIPPIQITVATLQGPNALDDYCTKRGYTPLSLEDGSIYWQLCYYCANVVEIIISPQAILATSTVFTSWTQTGYKDDQPGTIRFKNTDGSINMTLCLVCHDGLYYCVSNVFTVNSTPTPTFTAKHVVTTKPPASLCRPSWYGPTTKAKQLESELWLLCLGSPGVSQLDHLPSNAIGLPAEFDHHPFRFIDFKEQAKIRQQAAHRSAIRTAEQRGWYYMDFGFMQASAGDYTHTNKSTDRIVFSYDGYTSYLLIIDEASWYLDELGMKWDLGFVLSLQS
jgi:hypothetical protein